MMMVMMMMMMMMTMMTMMMMMMMMIDVRLYLWSPPPSGRTAAISGRSTAACCPL